MAVNRWLKYYVQMRLMDRDLPRDRIQVIPMISAFIASSFFHGIELGYSFFFATLFLNSVAAKLIEQSTLAHAVMRVVPWKVLFVPLWIWNFFQLSYGGMPFVWLYYERFDHMHAAFGYFLHWFYPVYLLVAFALPKVKKEKPGPKTG